MNIQFILRSEKIESEVFHQFVVLVRENTQRNNLSLKISGNICFNIRIDPENRIGFLTNIVFFLQIQNGSYIIRLKNEFRIVVTNTSNQLSFFIDFPRIVFCQILSQDVEFDKRRFGSESTIKLDSVVGCEVIIEEFFLLYFERRFLDISLCLCLLECLLVG